MSNTSHIFFFSLQSTFTPLQKLFKEWVVGNSKEHFLTKNKSWLEVETSTSTCVLLCYCHPSYSISRCYSWREASKTILRSHHLKRIISIFIHGIICLLLYIKYCSMVERSSKLQLCHWAAFGEAQEARSKDYRRVREYKNQKTFTYCH